MRRSASGLRSLADASARRAGRALGTRRITAASFRLGGPRAAPEGGSGSAAGAVCREMRSLDAQLYTTVLGSAVRGVVGRQRARFAEPFNTNMMCPRSVRDAQIVLHRADAYRRARHDGGLDAASRWERFRTPPTSIVGPAKSAEDNEKDDAGDDEEQKTEDYDDDLARGVVAVMTAAGVDTYGRTVEVVLRQDHE